tara:strand:- start:788 stop:1246 length:459 start_codon:yes stop_codon:yes gene_type:complete
MDLTRLFPQQANNDYRGSKIALFVFPIIALAILGRSLIHFLKSDSGVNSIATIITFEGTPDPNQVIYLFASLWGSQQLIMALLYGLVLLRYRALIPLMYLLLAIEICFRLISGILHPLTEIYYLQTPPGSAGNIPVLIITFILLLLALRQRP